MIEYVYENVIDNDNFATWVYPLGLCLWNKKAKQKNLGCCTIKIDNRLGKAWGEGYNACYQINKS